MKVTSKFDMKKVTFLDKVLVLALVRGVFSTICNTRVRPRKKIEMVMQILGS